MSVGVLFPGQGEALEPVIEEWYEGLSSVRHLVDEAAAQSKMTVAQLFDRGCRALRRTDVLQPVSVALSLGIFRKLTRLGVRPSVVAGHSLGEVAALAAAGLVEPQRAVGLAALRGRLMARESASTPGGMIAVGVPRGDALDRLVAEGGRFGMLSVAGYNSTSQSTLSGEPAALRAVRRLTRAVPVPVSGPWHCKAMAGAVEELRTALSGAIRGGFRTPMVFNRTGRIESEVSAVPGLVAGQLTGPVDWVASMRTLTESDVTDVIIPGPGRALRGFVREGLGGRVAIHVVDGVGRLAPQVEALRS